MEIDRKTKAGNPAAVSAVVASLAPVVIEIAKKNPQLISSIANKLSTAGKTLLSKDLLGKLFKKPGTEHQDTPIQLKPSQNTELNITPEQLSALSAVILSSQDALTKNQRANGPSVVDQLRFMFVESVCASDLFKKMNEKDPTHCSLLLSSDDTDFLHFLYFAHNVVKNYIIQKEFPYRCNFCNHHPTNKTRFLIFMYKNRDGLAHFFNTWFNTDLVFTLNLFENLKPIVSPFDGTYGWDLNLIMLNNLKKINTSPSPNHVQYHGILYKLETTESVIFKALSIMSTFMSKGIQNYTCIYSVKKVFVPEHWCGIFIDFQSRIFYFYNSLANPAQTDTTLFTILNQLCIFLNQPKFEFITNKTRQQDKSKLCGMYAFHFITKMAKKNSPERLELFKTLFDDRTSLSDEKIPLLLPEYLNIPDTHSQSMMDYFFSTLDPILFS